MAIEWQEEYKTGIEKIDAQHRQLFKLINGMESLIERRVHEGPEIEGLLMFLGGYIKTHFAFEESCMFKHACPVSHDNAKAHHEFIAFFEATLAEREKGKPGGEWLKKLHQYLSHWMVSHICQVDTKLRPCVHSSR